MGQIVADSVSSWLKSEGAKKLLTKLNQAGVKLQPFKEAAGSLRGQNFVLTGSLKSYSRGQAREKIESLGGSFQTSVTKETDYVVVGDEPGESKLKRAKALKTPQLAEADFIKLIGEG